MAASSMTLAAPRPEDDPQITAIRPIVERSLADSIDFCVGIRDPTDNFRCRLQRVRDLVR